MLQNGNTTNRIKGKIGLNETEAEHMASLIVRMEKDHAPLKYGFSFQEGDLSDLDNVITYLNSALETACADANVPVRTFTHTDFVKAPWNEQ